MRTLFGPCAVLLLLLTASPARAQTGGGPVPGVRAAGMAGAFTAVADDASAVFWNPAGLASGSFFSLALDHNTRDDASATFLTLGTPPLGLSYFRTSSGGADDQARSLVAHHAGVTFVQSLADRIAVGATVKVVHGEARITGGPAISSNKVDLDIGVMATGSLGRLGLAIHNVTAPSFDTTADPIELDRRVRGGISINTGRHTTVSADFDFTRTEDIATGEPWREAAVGVETQFGRKGWGRAGVRWNTAGESADPAATIGASYAVYGSTLADAHVSLSPDDRQRGWGLGLRFVF